MTALAPDNGWILAEFEGEDASYLVRVRRRPPDAAERTAYPVVVRAFWPFEADEDGDDALPDDDTFDTMASFENALYAAMAKDGFGVGVAAITGGGEKEWIFYARDADDFARHLNAALAGHPVYPITLEVGEDPDWRLFHDLLPRGTVH